MRTGLANVIGFDDAPFSAQHRGNVAVLDVRARNTVDRLAVSSFIPEPLRAARLIAGALARGQSRGRP